MGYELIVFALFVLVGLIGSAIGFWLMMRKRAALRLFAEHNALSYSRADVFNVLGRSGGIQLLNAGHDRVVHDIVYGTHRGLSVCFFHFKYKTGSSSSGRSRDRTHRRNGLLVVAPISLPGHLYVRAENFLDSLGELSGVYDDIDFEHSSFNDKYYVKSDNKRMAYDFFGRDMIEFFYMLPRRICMEACGPHFVFHYNNKIPTKYYARMLDTATSVFGKLDDLTREKYGMSKDLERAFAKQAEAIQKENDPLRKPDYEFDRSNPFKRKSSSNSKPEGTDSKDEGTFFGR
ncbi:MAG: hypothetical protein U5N86_05955 [Planctomycetota bacterium]|nr:hypothetical protein [Planctomycetota bacterium]